MSKSFKDFLNLNTYAWWRNHRRFVTIGLFLAIFANFIRTPSSNDYTIKDTCARLNSNYQITGKEALEKLNLKSINSYDDRLIANYYCERYLGIK